MSSSNIQERDDRLLAIGAQCSHDTCHLVDFLPFTCAHCKNKFCQDHFKTEDHSCPDYDEAKHNRVAPNCPLCNTPVAIPPGQNPNIRMEAHLRNDCSVLTGKVAKKSGPVCASGKCGKVLIQPITCTTCRKQYCPTHRFPSDHTCVAPPPTVADNAKKTAANIKSSANMLSGKAAAAKNALDTKVQKGISAAQTAASSTTTKSLTSGINIKAPPGFSKTDSVPLSAPLDSSSPPGMNLTVTPTTTCKPNHQTLRTSFAPPPVRARAERESRKKALKERAAKGILTTKEKAALAQLDAEDEAAGGASGEDKNCLIM
ncbi:hypothetical protein DL96DRAFT_1712366 [Flagelloscypha sp. PMI_526]|nr:hypothetical protein DL96DRAFT_1712366 [Flagelloscypha sp. PMI_526]